MRRVPPSAMAREEIQQLLTNGSLGATTNILSQLALLGVQYLGQLGMEQEQTDLLGRGHYERAEEPKGYRNGYEDRKVVTAEGPVGFRVPQVRGTDERFGPRSWTSSSATPRCSRSWWWRCTPGDFPPATSRTAFGTKPATR